ncbi:phosphocarrier protein [Amycolatopsis bartoniae]|uniref:Phosphocarrier protein HPr n=1 Tax=Amycolatopsis bartoniae TaxID=941986 RepID=A0A8H9IS12_9PSEU|nr:HPr family phosphocarrier protein [Amycolatopsis bartoniae]MBB2939523.1 phosphocarrier protein [Amycolatopsis bartoniae]TVT00337.1 HPr family phosphocarrier protein [Amycolatopsis bartoniae]GHF38913.1 phosphocarrier protein HPr [Amycolatopsis bartoniae]
MPERRVIVGSSVGLHARPAALFVKAAAAQPVPVTIGVGDGDPVDARSLLSVMGLGARGGDEVVLRAEGPEAESALSELASVIEADHDAA